MAAVLDAVAALLLLTGSLLCLCAAVGLIRFPDLLSRMHAATKPQVLGVVLVMLGVGLGLRSGLDVGMLVLVAIFQLLTTPVASHMMSRAALRTGQGGRPEDHRRETGDNPGL
ncbi:MULTISPECIES: monovalent cation/H(+) antiporter subunit G [unclassified Luteococcus]|uniref:monovalent cation/H(+) antiporter subunit G n=1 Tax=unclassified Luteococcus TaxID=2639923 RepID=UPI00313C6730